MPDIVDLIFKSIDDHWFQLFDEHFKVFDGTGNIKKSDECLQSDSPFGTVS